MTTLSICWALLVAALRSELQYRANFLVMIVTGIVWQVTGFVFIWVVLSKFEALAGWTLGEVAFLYGLRLTAHGLWLIPFNRLIEFDWLVRLGEFDRYLVRPLNPLLQLITSRVRIGGLGDLMGGIVILAAAGARAAVDWSPLAVGYLLLALLGGAMVEASLQLAVAAFSFRLLQTMGLRLMIDDVFSKFGGYPLPIFGSTMQFLLTFVLPLAFVAYLPATVLLDRTDELRISPLFAYLVPVVGAICFTAAYLFWQWETRNYQSSGH